MYIYITTNFFKKERMGVEKLGSKNIDSFLKEYCYDKKQKQGGDSWDGNKIKCIISLT